MIIEICGKLDKSNTQSFWTSSDQEVREDEIKPNEISLIQIWVKCLIHRTFRIFLSYSVYMYIYTQIYVYIYTQYICTQTKPNLYVTHSSWGVRKKMGIILNCMCPRCNGYRRRIWTRRDEFKSGTWLIAFHIALIPLGKVWIQIYSLQIWVYSRAECVLQSWWVN